MSEPVESSAAAPPAESKAASTGGTPGAPSAQPSKANPILTSADITSLLKNELSLEEPSEPELKPKEAQPGDEGESTEIPAEEPPETPPAEPAEIPEALTKAIEEWEQNGGGELPPALQGLVDRRIGKLTGQRETERQAREAAETRLQALEAENQQLRNGAPAAAPSVDEPTLSRYETTCRALVDDAENYLDDSANRDERERIERYMAAEGLDERGLKRRVRELRRFLADEAPRQRAMLTQFIAKERELEPQAKTFFPWLWDRTSPEYAQAQEVLKVLPDLPRRTPAHRFALGIYVLGLKAFDQLRSKAPPAALPKTPPPKVPVRGAAPPAAIRSNGKVAAENAARERFNKHPTRETVTELLKIGLLS
jgi:hypothetical protein